MMEDFWRDSTLHPDMPVLVRDTLREIGHRPILQLQLARQPVRSMVRKLGDFFSKNKFSDTIAELGYDEIWHNYLLITIKIPTKYGTLSKLVQRSESMEVTKVYLLEKGPLVQLKEATSERCIHTFDIPLKSKRLTVETLIRTALCLYPNFFIYDALNMNTCQSFVQCIVDANGLTDHITDQTTMAALQPQDATTLIHALGSLKDLPVVITDGISFMHKLIDNEKMKHRQRQKKKLEYDTSNR